MVEQFDINSILFIDIETVPLVGSFEELSDPLQELWGNKCKSILKKSEDLSYDEIAATFSERAGIFAEFGKIICISVGFVRSKIGEESILRLKSFHGNNERKILEDFSAMLEKNFNSPSKHFLCGHNLREFDIPYICRRMVINRLHLPDMLNISGKKPWETKHLIDTLELWKFGDIKNYTSLKLLCAVMGIASPKDDIDGSKVGAVYWEDNDLERIATYCEKDVLAVVQVFLSFSRINTLAEHQIQIIK
ncbi:MAG: 3'-5' exonuclease [Saprospiraceae bacterium]|nr:3'-5' exonuclease [Saprospiraceae bacterium]